MSGPYIQEWWASDSADVQLQHVISDASKVEEHGYFDGDTYRAEFRMKVDGTTAKVGFDPDGYTRIVIRGGHQKKSDRYLVVAGGDINPDIARNEVSVCGYLVMEGAIEKVRDQVLALMLDYTNWRDREKYKYYTFELPKIEE